MPKRGKPSALSVPAQPPSAKEVIGTQRQVVAQKRQERDAKQSELDAEQKRLETLEQEAEQLRGDRFRALLNEELIDVLAPEHSRTATAAAHGAG